MRFFASFTPLAALMRFALVVALVVPLVTVAPPAPTEAHATTVPQFAPALIWETGFEGTYPPAGMTIGANPLPSQTPVAAWWGRLTLSKRTGSYGLWCAGSSLGNWSTYPAKTSGRATIALPQLAEYYSSQLAMWYTMPTRGAADWPSLLVGWYDHADPGNWHTFANFSLATGWVQRTFDLSATTNDPALTRRAGSIVLEFDDRVEGSGQSPTTGRGPTIDDIAVTGYRYGPVRDLAVTSPVPGRVDLAWRTPAASTRVSTDDSRSIVYRVWRRPLGGSTWTQIPGSPTSDLALSDTTVAGGTTYTYVVQAWGTGDVATFWGAHQTRDVSVSVVDTTGPAITGLASSTHPSADVWYPSNSPVSFAWAESTDPAGVDGYSVSWSTVPASTPDNTIDLSGATNTSYSIPGGPVADGEWYFSVKARDGALNWGDPVSRRVRIDATAPTGSIVLAGGAATTTSREVAVSSGVSFGPSGPHPTEAMRFSVDGGSSWGSWIPFSAESQVTLPQPDGVKTVHAQFRDGAGNTSAGVISDSITLDTVAAAPRGTIAIAGGADYTAVRAVTVANDITFPNGPHPTEAMRFSVDGGSTWTTPAPYSATVDLLLAEGADGSRSVRGIFTDADGIESVQIVDTIVLDTAAPTGTISLEGGADYATSAQVHVESTVEFGVSGAHPTEAMRFSVDGGATWGGWQPFAASTLLSLGAPDGNRSVRARYKDAAGNLSTALIEDVILLDTVAPAIIGLTSPTHGSAGVASEDTEVRFAWSATAPSGIAGYSFSWTTVPGLLPDDTVDSQVSSGEAVFGPDLADGTYHFSVKARNHAGVWGAPSTLTVVIDRSAGAVTVEPLEGVNRYETAIAVARAAFPGGADAAVIATGQNWPDALGASALAGVVGGPLVLTRSSTLPQQVLDYLAVELAPSRVFIVGGEVAVSTAVLGQIAAALPGTVITRIAGDDRIETAQKVAARVVAERSGGATDVTAFVATSRNYPDALATSPLAAARAWPLYLCPGTSIADSTIAAMKAAGVTRVVVAGGEGVVSPAVEQRLKAEFPAVIRRAGADRYSTTVAVAQWGVAEAGLGWDQVAIATGTAFPDALAGGVLQGLDDSVLLLTAPFSLSTATEQMLREQRGSIGTVRFLGGTSAISEDVRGAIINVLEEPL